MSDSTMHRSTAATSRTPELIRSKLLEKISHEIIYPNSSYAETLDAGISRALGAVGALESVLISVPRPEGRAVQTIDMPVEELSGYLEMIKRELVISSFLVEAIIDNSLLAGSRT